MSDQGHSSVTVIEEYTLSREGGMSDQGHSSVTVIEEYT